MLLHGEEKKDGGSPLYTPNPLAAGDRSASSVPAHGTEKMEAQDPPPRYAAHPPPPPPASATPAGVPNPIGGVPNPMRGSGSVPTSVPSSHTLPFETSPITLTQTVGDPTITSHPSSVPSPLASPVLTMHQFADDRPSSQPSSQPPSRPASVLSADASTMEAMATAMDADDPSSGRPRANTVHYPLSAGGNSPHDGLRDGESLQPVNFGDSGQHAHFSPGASGQSRRKLSNASASSPSQASSSMGVRSASSGSLYSEGSHDSHSGGGSPGHVPAPATSAAPAAYAPGKLSGPNPRAPTGKPVDKRQKRLERNRESARASRRRRKAYLEELEVRVNSLSDEMDRGRMDHACGAIGTVRGMRMGKLRECERIVERGGAGGAGATAGTGIRAPVKPGIAHGVRAVPARTNAVPRSVPSSLDTHVQLLTGSLSRASDELQIVQTFLAQQLLSLVQPTASRLVLWLSLQREGFYRGGRSASERLSAARIGERLLHNGTYRAAPLHGMWPLLCHEVGLSYDQEERIRQTQRAVLAAPPTWVHRHTALATQNTIEGVHAAMGGAQRAAKRREKSLMDVLTAEQRVKFLAWAGKRQEALRRLAEARLGRGAPGGEGTAAVAGQEYETSPHRHVAANMYIINHRLSKVRQRAPPNSASFVPPTKLKKLGRRPSFESLAGHHGSESEGNSKLSRETSFPSTGSLKRSLNDVLGGDDNASHPTGMPMSPPGQNNVTPESAQAAAQSAIMAVLKEVLPIVPKSALHYSHAPHYAAYPPTAVASRPGEVQSQPQFQSAAAARPKPSRQRRNTMPQQAPATADVLPEVDDIPMPTPVSVLMQTADDFISPAVPYEQQEPLDAVTSSNPFATEAAAADFAIPEQVSSYAPEPFAGGLLATRHQSAPQLARGTPSPTDLSYPSALPAPMAMIPESSLVNNGSVMGASGDTMGDFGLEDLPEIGTDDWAIGEGFDMDIGEGAQGAA